VAYSRDGRWLAIGSSSHPDVAAPPFGRVVILDAATGQPVSKALEVAGWVWHIDFDSTGSRIAVADGITPPHQVNMSAGAHVIEWSTGQRVCSVKVQELRCRSAVFSADGKTLVTASEGTLATWDARTGQPLLTDVGTRGRNFLRLEPGTNRLWTGQEMSIELRELPDLKLVRTFEQPRDATAPGQVNLIGDVVRHVPSGAMVSGSWNGTITVWDFDSAQPLLTLPAHPTGVHHLLFSPDGRTLFSSGHDGHVRAWPGG
jgi:WD40 repeat protein